MSLLLYSKQQLLNLAVGASVLSVPAFAFHIDFLFRHNNNTHNNNNNNINQTVGNNMASTTRCNDFTSTSKQDPLLPTMIVFDLDDCLWTPEMHELPDTPNIPIQGSLLVDDNKSNDDLMGVVGLKVGKYGPTVTLHNGARRTLYELATNPIYQGIILATASSSLEPSYSWACLRGIEILPGVTMSDMFRHNQIGRTGRLSPRKTSHFTALHEESGIPFEEMLFFDDCNWGDHCATVTNAFGVVSYKTPYGLQFKEFQDALIKYRHEAQKR